jgi:hypothetical protein
VLGVELATPHRQNKRVMKCHKEPRTWKDSFVNDLVEGKEQYRVEISKSIPALENLDTKVDINRSWEAIRENINISTEDSLGY